MKNNFMSQNKNTSSSSRDLDELRIKHNIKAYINITKWALLAIALTVVFLLMPLFSQILDNIGLLGNGMFDRIYENSPRLKYHVYAVVILVISQVLIIFWLLSKVKKLKTDYAHL